MTTATAKTTGYVTINGIQYPIENFTITWHNNLEPYWVSGDSTLHFYDPTAETEEQKDERLNPRKYDSCKFCDHYRHRHEDGYGMCHGIDEDWDYEHMAKDKCRCEQFV